MAKYTFEVVDGYRWSYGDEEDETFSSGIHEIDTDDYPEGFETNLKNVAAANVGVLLVDEAGDHLHLITDNDGNYLVVGKDVCVACRGAGPLGELDHEKLPADGICDLCGFDNNGYGTRPAVREEEPIPAPQPERVPEPLTGEQEISSNDVANLGDIL